jgi:hypothetical protein
MEDNMKHIGIVSIIVLLAVSAHAQDNAQSAPAEPALITHVPLNEVLEGEVKLEFAVRSPDRAGAIVVRVTPLTGRPTAFEVLAHRALQGYEARLIASKIAPPGFSYYVVERMPDGSERPVFADKNTPHHVHVVRPSAVEAERERLAARGGQRSTLLLSGELVDFGDRRLTTGGAMTHDRYYRLEAGYAYSFLTTVEEVRLSLVRVRGEGGQYSDAPKPNSMRTEPGIDYGRAMVTVLALDEFRLRGAVLLGASQRGFEYGGGASIVVGNPRATNLDAGVEAMTTLGATAHLRLGFLATPRIPMGASIEITNFPLGDDAGVRLLYDIGYRFGPVTTLMLRSGYQGRTSVSGGPSALLSFEYGF